MTNKCKRLIKYNDRGIEFTFGSKINNYIPFVQIQVDPRKSDVCEIAKTLDDYQYRLCMLHKDSDHDSREYQEYLKKHERVLDLISSFRLALSSYNDSSKSNQEENIINSINAIQKFLQEETSENILKVKPIVQTQKEGFDIDINQMKLDQTYCFKYEGIEYLISKNKKNELIIGVT